MIPLWFVHLIAGSMLGCMISAMVQIIHSEVDDD